jgi:hypothetical protein
VNWREISTWQAQWIWWTNLICFVVHTFMALFTLHMGYWRHGLNAFTDEGEHMRVTIYRISQVPTVQVYMNNESVWSPGYNGSGTDPRTTRDIGGNEHWLHDNGMAVDFCWLTASFFLISAIFHLWALLVGIFERTWYMYWRQLDDAFAWWRWAEVRCTFQPHSKQMHTHACTTCCAVFLERQRHGHGYRHLHRPARAVHPRVHLHVRNCPSNSP